MSTGGGAGVPMTAGSATMVRTRTPPALTAQVVLGAVVAVNLVIVELLFLTAGTGKNAVLTVAKFFGLHAALIMMLQLLLVARLPWLDRRLGMDRLTAWHRWVGFTLLWTVITHATLVVLGYATLSGTPVFATFLSLAGVTASLLGMGAATVVVAVAALSMRHARRRMRYKTWHAVHLGLYAAVAPRSRSPDARGHHLHLVPARGHLLVDVVGSGRRCAGGRPGGRAGVAQRPAPVPRRRGRCRSRTRRCRSTSRDATSTACRLGRASSASGGSPTTTAGGRRTPSPSPPRPTAGTCASPPRPPARRAPACATCAVGSRVFVEGPYGAFTTLHQGTGAAASHRGRHRRHPDPLPAGGGDRTGRRALPGAHRGRRRPAPGAERAGPPVRRAGARAGRADGRAGRRRSPRSIRTTSPRWCPTSRIGTCSSAARRR